MNRALHGSAGAVALRVQGLALARQHHYNDHGDLLNHQFRISRESKLRNGSYEYGQINVNSAGIDDLLTRGNGVVKLPPNFNSFFEYERPRFGHWGYEIEAEAFSGGLVGQRQGRLSPRARAAYFVSDALNIYVGRAVRAHAGLAGVAAGHAVRQLRRAADGPERRLQLDHDAIATSCA